MLSRGDNGLLSLISYIRYPEYPKYWAIPKWSPLYRSQLVGRCQSIHAVLRHCRFLSDGNISLHGRGLRLHSPRTMPNGYGYWLHPVAECRIVHCRKRRSYSHHYNRDRWGLWVRTPSRRYHSLHGKVYPSHTSADTSASCSVNRRHR